MSHIILDFFLSLSHTHTFSLSRTSALLRMLILVAPFLCPLENNIDDNGARHIFYALVVNSSLKDLNLTSVTYSVALSALFFFLIRTALQSPVLILARTFSPLQENSLRDFLDLTNALAYNSSLTALELDSMSLSLSLFFLPSAL